MAGVIEATGKVRDVSISTSNAYDAYREFCQRAALRPLTGRAFGDLICELDIYSLLHSRIVSRGRYGRSREIVLDLPQEVIEELYGVIRLNFEVHS